MEELDGRNVGLMLRSFAKGQLKGEDAHLVEEALQRNPMLRTRVDALKDAADIDAWENALEAPFGARAKVVFEAMKADEVSDDGHPPIIHSRSRIEDFNDWVLPRKSDLNEMNGDLVWLPIASTEDTNSFLVRMSSPIENHVHMHELERVLVLEGHCTLHYADRIYQLGPGDSFVLSPQVYHAAHSSNDAPCTFICQLTKVEEG